MSNIKVIELFAGVGGFRLGLEGWNGYSASSGYKRKANSSYKVVWSNQWEPSTKLQHASVVYESRFAESCHSNEDIAKVNTRDVPEHDLLVGGFPCQDYSVARTLSQSEGIVGKKGVLWWEIYRILKEKGNKCPKYLMLENVDRLLKSPVKQRGRDFAIILSSLCDLGYIAEWRVINAAEYGMPQKRRRTFILAYHKKAKLKIKDPKEWVMKTGTLAKGFPVLNEYKTLVEFELDKDLVRLSENFNKKIKDEFPFHNAGMMIDGKIVSISTKPEFKGKRTNLGDILEPFDNVSEDYFLTEDEIPRWEYLKGSKREPRKNKIGEIFYYTEGKLPWPDSLDSPSRTIITSEGGRAASRFKHVVLQNERYRRLTPVELERLNMFPDNHTAGVADTKRAFFMGNALVVGVIERLGDALYDTIIQKQSTEKKQKATALA